METTKYSESIRGSIWFRSKLPFQAKPKTYLSHARSSGPEEACSRSWLRGALSFSLSNINFLSSGVNRGVWLLFPSTIWVMLVAHIELRPQSQAKLISKEIRTKMSKLPTDNNPSTSFRDRKFPNCINKKVFTYSDLTDSSCICMLGLLVNL